MTVFQSSRLHPGLPLRNAPLMYIKGVPETPPVRKIKKGRKKIIRKPGFNQV